MGKMAMLSVAASDRAGQVLRNDNARAVARAGRYFVELRKSDIIPLPDGASLMRLPGRVPVGADVSSGEFVQAGPGEAIAAILPQGYTRTFVPAYVSQSHTSRTSHTPGPRYPHGQAYTHACGDDAQAPVLPLFGYSAVAFDGDQMVVAAVRTDERDSWDPSHYNLPELPSLAEAALKAHAGNRVLRQLARCALEYQCYTAQNMFYRRWEAGIPVSPTCNARCVGCISKQPSECCPSPQQRIDFVPRVDEIVELALPHLEEAPRAIISFGQGCEGEPTNEWRVIAEACRAVRARTRRGTLNINTNAGNVEAIEALCDAGMDSFRVSLVSARPPYYERYHRPRGYALADVERSIAAARSRGAFVSINYLTFPGFTDLEPEVDAVCALIERTDVQMVQFRNLNIDPEVFCGLMLEERGELHEPGEAVGPVGPAGPAEPAEPDEPDEPAGIAQAVAHLQDCFPDLIIGNFSVALRD